MNGNEVKKIIEKCRVSQAEFARRIGAHTNTVNDWCNDRKPPSGVATTLLILLRGKPELISELENYSSNGQKNLVDHLAMDEAGNVEFAPEPFDNKILEPADFS
ncbi:MAG: hypothetical protein AAF228_13245 [Pseudomonadota bacterium]